VPHILIAKPIHESGLAKLRATPGLTLEVLSAPSPEEFDAHLRNADAVILRYQPLRQSQIDAAPQLKLVVRHGVGYDTVDLPALDARRIPLAITIDANAVSVAEHAMSLLLAVAHRTTAFDADARQGKWQAGAAQPMWELAGKKALVVGAGRIGRAMAHRLLAFGMDVCVFDPGLPAAAALPSGSRRAENLAAALAEADVVSLHLPLSEATYRLIDPLACKRGAVLVNTARGPLIDEGRLCEALQNGHLSGAGLDVFEEEPLRTSNPLLAFPNVMLSPHISSLTDAGMQRMGCECADHVISFFGLGISHAALVNPQVLAL
jgi:D-3-phosphoglycerate dehydrogenase